MSPGVLEHAFEPFFTTKEIGKGTGLGLSTVFGIVRQSGGAVRIRSRVGEGTTVEIYLPRTERTSMSSAKDPLPVRARASAGARILVVDDDVRNIFALSSVLERRGMFVLTAGTGREAIETLESTPDVAIVLMDIMMPEMDGYETMQVIRQNPSFRRLPIVALTAKAMKGDREKCMEAGASEYLAKPVNTEQLLSALRMWFHR